MNMPWNFCCLPMQYCRRRLPGIHIAHYFYCTVNHDNQILNWMVLQWKLFKEPRKISTTWHTPRTGFFRNEFLMRLQGIFYWLYLIETLTQTQFVNSHLSFVTRFVIKQWVCNSLCSFVSLCIAKYVELSARKSFTPKLLIYISKLVAEIAQ